MEHSKKQKLKRDMSSVQEYWDALPRLTKGYLMLIIGTTGLTMMGFVSPFKIVLLWPNVLQRFEIWRLFTNFLFFGKPSFMFLMQLMIIGRFGSGYENDPFRTGGTSTTADFLFAVLFNAGLLLGIGYAFEKVILGPSLTFSIIYLWSRRNPESPVSVWGFRFTGSQLPWVFIAMSTLMGGDPIPDIMGLVTSHLFYFLIEVLPLKNDVHYLTTPSIVGTMASYLTGDASNDSYSPPSAGSDPNPWRQRENTQPRTSTGYNWGTGQRLGGN